MKKFIEFVSEELESDDEEAERKAKLKAALAATAQVGKGGMQKKGYTGSTYNPQTKVQKEEIELDEVKAHTAMTDAELRKHISIHTRNALAHNLSKAASDNLRAAQAELKKREKQKVAEETELDEVAKPKGIVDKNVGKPPKASTSGFKTGQRVAHYRGMGKTLHGNVTNPDASSGGKKGAMVKFEHGTEFVPHKDLKDASQYWKDEDESMRKERDKPKSVAKEETALKTFSQFTKGAN